MFVTKRYHNSVVKDLQRQLELQERSNIVICDLLQSQISDLKKLIFIPQAEPTPSAREADNIMNVSEKPFEMSEAERTQMLEGIREMDLLVSGNYDTDLIS